MPDSAAFEFACDQLETRTALDRLAARGTVRIALKQAGLEPRSVTPDQMAVVIQKILPSELSNRGVDAVEDVCQRILSGLRGVSAGAASETPDAIFKRLGGS
jgi:hypothetical protein